MEEYLIEYKVKGKAFARVMAESLDEAMSKALDHDVVDYDEIETDFYDPIIF